VRRRKAGASQVDRAQEQSQERARGSALEPNAHFLRAADVLKGLMHLRLVLTKVVFGAPPIGTWFRPPVPTVLFFILPPTHPGEQTSS